MKLPMCNAATKSNVYLHGQCLFIKLVHQELAVMQLLSKNLRRRKARKTPYSATVSEDSILMVSAKSASSKAVRSSKALGISFKIIKEGKIIIVNADRSQIIEREIRRSAIDLSKLKKGMYLERK